MDDEQQGFAGGGPVGPESPTMGPDAMLRSESAQAHPAGTWRQRLNARPLPEIRKRLGIDPLGMAFDEDAISENARGVGVRLCLNDQYQRHRHLPCPSRLGR